MKIIAENIKAHLTNILVGIKRFLLKKHNEESQYFGDQSSDHE